MNVLEQEIVQSLNICKGNYILGGTPFTSVKINEFLLLITCTSNWMQNGSKDFHGVIMSL